MATIAQFLGSLIPIFCFIRILLYIFKRLRKQENNPGWIIGAGFAALALATVISGYGMQDYSLEPQFVFAFSTYLPAVLVVLCLELYLSTRRARKGKSRGA